MSAGGGRPKERPILNTGHDKAHYNKAGSSTNSHRPGAPFSNSYHGETFAQQHYGHMISSSHKPRPTPVDLTQSADNARLVPDRYKEHNRRMVASLQGRPPPPLPLVSQSMPSQPSSSYQDRSDPSTSLHINRERTHPSHVFTDSSVGASPEKRNTPLHPPPMDNVIAPLPKKARYTQDGNRIPQQMQMPMSWNQPLCIDTSLDANKMKMEPPGGYHPETEAISPTLPTESQDSKSEIVHSISVVDREIGVIENQIQQLQKKQSKLEAEAAKPKGNIADEDGGFESKPLSIAQIIYRENGKLAQQSHHTLSQFGATLELPLFHQPCDTDVFEENVKKFAEFKSVLQSYFKKKTIARARHEQYLGDTYSRLVTAWLKKVDAKTIKKNIKDLKTREYFEKVFPEIKKAREDKERLTSRVGARGVSSGYARTEAEFEQIIDGINEQEEEDKKMRAYAIIPPMLSQQPRKLRFINRNGLVPEALSGYKERRQMSNWSTEEKEIFKDKYLERPKQFGHIADAIEKKSLNDCVLYYYMSKKQENFKQMLKKQAKRPPRRQPLKNSIRNSNESHMVVNSESTSSTSKAYAADDQEDIVRVTRSAVDDGKFVCAACGIKLESYSVSHAVTKSTCAQFGLDANNFQSEWRVCANCAKLRRRRNKTCPVPSCTTPSRRARHLPVKWDELAPTTRTNIMKELGLEEEVNKCCSACYDKIADLLMDTDNENEGKPNEGHSTKWSMEDINALKDGIKLHGKSWQAVSAAVSGKSEEQCKLYFYRNKKKLGLDNLYLEFKKRRSETHGFSNAPSEDSGDDEDDDNMEDNDMSSDNDNPTNEAVNADSSIRSATRPSIITSIATPSSSSTTAVAQQIKSSPTTQLHKLENSCSNWDTKPIIDAPIPMTKMMNGDIDSGNMKPENKYEVKVKEEKFEYDSSATASAEEEESQPISQPMSRAIPMPVDNISSVFAGPSNVMLPQPKEAKNYSAVSYKRTLELLEKHPGLMTNPDGMIPPHNFSNTAPVDAPPPPQPLPIKRQIPGSSTSVRDLIESAIETALSSTANITYTSQRESINSRNLPCSTTTLTSKGSAGVISSTGVGGAPLDQHKYQNARLDHRAQSPYNLSSRSTTPNRPPSVKDESMIRKYEDPRAILSASQSNIHLGNPNYHHTHRGEQRAPPPAHSHHYTAKDRKSPAAKGFNHEHSMSNFDNKNGQQSSSRMSPHVKQQQPNIGPPPLISSGIPHHPSHPHHLGKKENSHAGGSILQGTSASHSQMQPTRFEGGSISHGTPRNLQTESKSLTPQLLPGGRNGDRPTRSPRSQQQSMHSPAMQQSQQQQQQKHQYEKLIEQQQQQQQHHMMAQYMQQMEALRRNHMAAAVPGGFPFTPAVSSFEPYPTKSVLQNDFITAKQMSAGGGAAVNLSAAGAAAYSPAAALSEREKSGKASPHPNEQMLAAAAAAAAGIPPGMMDPQTMMMLMNPMMMQRMAPERQRLLAASNPSSTSPRPKEELPRSWAPHNMSSSPANLSRQEPVRSHKPSIMQGMIPKTVESLHRTSESSRQPSNTHSHMRGDNKTHFQKEIEEVQMRSLSEQRTRTDSERTLTDTESSSQPAPSSYPTTVSGSRGIPTSADMFGIIPRSSSVGSRSDLGPSRMDQSNYLMKQQQQHPQQHSQQHPQQHPLNYKGSSSVTPSGMKAEDMSRDSKKLSELRERLPGGRPGYPYTSSPYARPEDSRLNTLVEGDKRGQASPQMPPYSSSSGPTDLSRTSNINKSSDSVYVSKKLAEVSKVLQKEHLHKDASTLFSTSFEKDHHHSASAHLLGCEAGSEGHRGLTTARYIDLIITNQINSDSSNAEAAAAAAANKSNNLMPASALPTSVIVPPNKQRPIQHSRSDTEISNYNLTKEQRANHSSSTPPTGSGGGSGTPVKVIGPITIADKINELIDNHTDYKTTYTVCDDSSKVNERPGSSTAIPRPDSARSTGSNYSSSSSLMPQLPYRVEDVEPISPPSSSSSQTKGSKYLANSSGGMNKPFKPPTGVKNAGIRSLLGADNPSSGTDSSNTARCRSSEIFTPPTGVPVKDVKNNKELMRHEHDMTASQPKYSPYPMPPQHINRMDNAMDDASNREGNRKRHLEAMLAPSSNKRLAMSQRRAGSPEEVDLYTPSSSGSETRTYPPTSSPYQTGSNSMYRPPTSNPYQHQNTNSYVSDRSPGSGSHRKPPFTASPYDLSNAPPSFSVPGSTSSSNHTKSSQQPSSPFALTHKSGNNGYQMPPGASGTGSSYSYTHSAGGASSSTRVPNAQAAAYNYSQNSISRSSSTDVDNDLVIDEGSNSGYPMDSSSREQVDTKYSERAVARSPNVHSKHPISSMTRGVLPPHSTSSPINAGQAGGNQTSPATTTPLTNNNSPRAGSDPYGAMMSPMAANRVSPMPGSRASPCNIPTTSTGSRQSPLQANRQSPIQPNRQSPLVNRLSPMDGMVKSPSAHANRGSSPARINHTNVSSSATENHIPNSLAQKNLEVARSLNSLGSSHPLFLSENYDTLSEDET